MKTKDDWFALVVFVLLPILAYMGVIVLILLVAERGM